MSAANSNGFIYQKGDDGIVTVIMDMDGPVNAMNAQYRQAMTETVDRLYQEESLKGVVVASAKKTFFAGGDINEMLGVKKGQEVAQFHRIEGIKGDLRRLEKLQVPVVAAINGAALGGGLEICLACNHRVIWNSAKAVIGFPEVSLGLLPGGGGIVRSIHMLGLDKALPHLLDGTRMPPEQALTAGYVDMLVEDSEQLIITAKTWIKENPKSWAQPWDQKNHIIPGGNVWHPNVVRTLSVAPATLFKKTRGLLPAPEKILAVAGDVMAVDFDTALRIEARALAYLITTAEAKNIITSTFVQMNAINSGSSRAKNIDAKKVKKLGILGAGMMGQGIAYVSSMAGIDVVLKDISVDAAEKGKTYTDKLLNKRVAQGKMSEEDKTKALNLIKVTDQYSDLQGCDLVIEAVFEDIQLKARVTKEAEAFLGDNAVFASNTSTLPISQLAEASRNSRQFIGIHFFSPVNRMPLIEIIRGEQTSDETLALAFDYARQIRKTPIVVNDALGFFTSRVFGTYMDEGARLLVEGLDPILIDAMGKQVGMPVGPLTIQDEVSQELSKRAAETHREMGVFGSLGDNSVNAQVCETLVNDHGRGGRHHGGGYYEYCKDGSKQVWPKLYDMYHKAGVKMPENDIKDRILFRQVIESLKCLQEGVLSSVADGNVGSLLGIGAPTWTGGFIQFVNTYGLKKFIIRCDELTEQYGDRFKAPKIVAEKIAQNSSFL